MAGSEAEPVAIGAVLAGAAPVAALVPPLSPAQAVRDRAKASRGRAAARRLFVIIIGEVPCLFAGR
ncbi:hypothetical protein GCM10009560_44990 [Nonomuraea longicatena]|uniref:Uncharacterized protein n=1 Tax=Nonomuraea longicatena TaxID=83682 RepID=A0ABP4AGG3_9ACTN